MQNESILYVGFYDTHEYADEKRVHALSATNKMDYIASAVVNSGKLVTIVSPSWSDNPKGWYPGRQGEIAPGIELVMGPSFGARCRLAKGFRILFSWLWLIWYMGVHTCKGKSVLMYHAILLIVPIRLIHRIRKFRLILEVEEIFQDAVDLIPFHQKAEYTMFRKADAFLFSTELLNDKLNPRNKPSAIVYGSYAVEPDRDERFDDGKIHVVYAGTFDPRKGGALTAAAMAEFLDENYHLHIIGFGSESEKGVLLDIIQRTSQKTKCMLTFDGIFHGENYIRFLQKCDIGLSTQTPVARYSDTSFPSKVLSYMANGLRVVSIRIKVLEKSTISDLLYYYDNDNPREIAQIIQRADYKKTDDCRKRLESLHGKFINDIRQLIT